MHLGYILGIDMFSHGKHRGDFPGSTGIPAGNRRSCCNLQMTFSLNDVAFVYGMFSNVM